ncbi:hypothetical protein QP254_20305 [Klebsiella quasivariicola]|uniref:hypothetical protein n=1 Tax=Klebsiella quasivariicola TaxID=2026240 RepID=UPI0025573E80|nr:hypothetical protein [Klebsiella quasivariicola]MDK6607941.1 hypothetical protein [Klebsiella quasivariicola]
MNIETVNELIASLESAGELSIREQKFLKLAKAYQQLAAENVALKATSDDRRMFIMNGVQLGYIKVPTVETDPALETIRIAVSPQEPTPATDRIVAGIKADGVEMFVVKCREKSKQAISSDIRNNWWLAGEHADDFAKQVREGADK